VFTKNRLTEIVMPNGIELGTWNDGDLMGEGTEFKDLYYEKGAETYRREIVDDEWKKVD